MGFGFGLIGCRCRFWSVFQSGFSFSVSKAQRTQEFSANVDQVVRKHQTFCFHFLFNFSFRTLDFSEIETRELADAILVIDFENLSRVPIEDFLFKRWEAGKRELENGKPTHIFVCVKRWVHLGDWVASEIVCM